MLLSARQLRKKPLQLASDALNREPVAYGGNPTTSNFIVLRHICLR